MRLRLLGPQFVEGTARDGYTEIPWRIGAMSKGPRKHQKRLNRDGLPVEAKDWVEADWADLHYAMEKVKKNIAARHAEKSRGKKR